MRIYIYISFLQDVSEALNLSSSSFRHNLDRLYIDCPNNTHEFLGGSLSARKAEADEAQEASLQLLLRTQGLPQWISQRTKD